jgi:OPA family sugar phosphate sensor protein UhpC-like MFS transporter
LLAWFRTGPDAEPAYLTPREAEHEYRRRQWRVIIGLIVGYSFFYTCRLSLSVAKKPMLDEGVLTVDEVGLMGSALLFTYAFGRFTNGFLSDYANIRRFMSFGLLSSAILNLAIGATSSAWAFIALWGLNGWFQSMGSAPSAVSIFQWFSPRHRGSRYSVWAGSHNIGEGITFVVTSGVVATFGWRAGFVVPAVMCIGIAAVMMFLLEDRPATRGLPKPHEAFGEPPDDPTAKKSLGTFRAQLGVLRTPVVWVVCLACASMYVSRYAINSWGLLYLQEAKGYELVDAGFAMGAYPILGLAGAVLSGIVSDAFFRSDRHLPTFLYGLCNVGGMALLFFGPQNRWVDAIALGIFGFGIGGLIVFLGGLTAAELVSRKAVGAVKGFIGLFSYLAASLQEYLSGLLIEAPATPEDGGGYDFSAAIVLWMGAGFLSIALAAAVRFLAPPPPGQGEKTAAEPT